MFARIRHARRRRATGLQVGTHARRATATRRHARRAAWAALPALAFWVAISALAVLSALSPAPALRAVPAAAPAGSSQQVRAAGPQGVLLPAGTFTLGSDKWEKAFAYRIGGEGARRWRWFDNEPWRRVILAAFRLDLTLVTQAAYGRFVRATGHRRPFISREDYRRQGFLVHPYREVLPFLWFSDEPVAWLAEHPVTLVSVGDAETFCAWRGRQAGGMCRLPREDQWERAARGWDGRYFPWGDGWRPRLLNSEAHGPYNTTPVRAYPGGRTPEGLYDMAGNLFQWTSTPGRHGRNILKGCSWDDAGGICRGAARHDRKKESRHILIGFRCACNVKDARRK